MRPPLRVEAKVAEELRNWLTSELERLDATNTNPFAHHVVTILLQDDLDIDDEPLSTDGCFDQWGINFVKGGGQTRDKKIKAAVQFLRSAITSEEAFVESKIETIVNELVIRIEETKQKLKQKKSRGRDLLGSLTINTDNQVKRSVNSGSREGERSYNEVFPSLSGEVVSVKTNLTSIVSPNNSVWNKSPTGKENDYQANVRKYVRKVRFADRDEAEAFSIAARVFALTMPDVSLPNPEAMEVSVSRSLVFDISISSPDPFDGCWKSAFSSYKPTSKPFAPSERRVPLPIDPQLVANPILCNPVVIQEYDGARSPSASTISSHEFVKLLDPKEGTAFLPAENTNRAQTLSVDAYLSPSVDSNDIEVICIFSTVNAPNQRMRNAKRRWRPEQAEIGGANEEIRGARAFPNHHGDFWNDLATIGAISLYPRFCVARLPRSESVPHHHLWSEENAVFGAVGSQFLSDDGDDDDDDLDAELPQYARPWDDVTFTDNLYDFAMEKMSNLKMHSEEADRAASQDGTDDDGSVHAWISRPSPSEDWCGTGGWFGASSRAIIASSDSGILLHAAAERYSASPCSDPSLSAPASLQLPHAGWPLEKPKINHYQAQHDRPLPNGGKNQQHSDVWGWPVRGSGGKSLQSDKKHNVQAWPEPPPIDWVLSNNAQSEMRSHTPSHHLDESGEVRSNTSCKDELPPWWSSPPGESVWEPMQGGLFLPVLGHFSHNFASYISDRDSTTHAIGRTPPSISLPLDKVPIPSLSNTLVTFSPPPNSLERLGIHPSPPVACQQSFPKSDSLRIFPPSSVPTHFMPSKLSQGTGMSSSVSQVLQNAYVNSMFSNTESEAASDLMNMSCAVNCVDLETSWFSSVQKDSKQVSIPIPEVKDVVVGRTCSLYLENNCDRGSACPFLHPSL